MNSVKTLFFLLALALAPTATGGERSAKRPAKRPDNREILAEMEFKSRPVVDFINGPAKCGKLPVNHQMLIWQHMRGTLHDPYSAVYDFTRERPQKGWLALGSKATLYGWIVPFHLNSKNLYGAYVGERQRYCFLYESSLNKDGWGVLDCTDEFRQDKLEVGGHAEFFGEIDEEFLSIFPEETRPEMLQRSKLAELIERRRRDTARRAVYAKIGVRLKPGPLVIEAKPELAEDAEETQRLKEKEANH